MFKILRLRLQKEIEELKSIHRIEMKEKEADLTAQMRETEALLRLQIRDQEEQLKRTRADLIKDNEIKTREVVSLLKLESEGRIKQLELDYQRKIDETKRVSDLQLIQEKERVIREGYEHLSAAMSKLHEEGNVTTRFTQDLALKMMGSAPAHKTETRVLTGKAE